MFKSCRNSYYYLALLLQIKLAFIAQRKSLTLNLITLFTDNQYGAEQLLLLSKNYSRPIFFSLKLLKQTLTFREHSYSNLLKLLLENEDNKTAYSYLQTKLQNLQKLRNGKLQESERFLCNGESVPISMFQNSIPRNELD